MMGQLKTLLRVKSLKEEQALRTLQAKRRQVEDGKVAVAQAKAVEAESKRTLSSREDAIYGKILGRVISLDALDDTHAEVVTLEKSHARLSDNTERSTHVLARLDKELDTSVTAHRFAVKVKDKYTLLLDDVREKVETAASAAEENEVEELFGTRRQELP